MALFMETENSFSFLTLQILISLLNLFTKNFILLGPFETVFNV